MCYVQMQTDEPNQGCEKGGIPSCDTRELSPLTPENCPLEVEFTVCGTLELVAHQLSTVPLAWPLFLVAPHNIAFVSYGGGFVSVQSTLK